VRHIAAAMLQAGRKKEEAAPEGRRTLRHRNSGMGRGIPSGERHLGALEEVGNPATGFAVDRR
jgi:hypothetical protein